MGARDVAVANPDVQTVMTAGGFWLCLELRTVVVAFLGKLRDKVGQGNGAFSADGALDGSFRVTIQAGSGARTVTRLALRRAGGGGVWGTEPERARVALRAHESPEAVLFITRTRNVSL